VAKRPRSHFRKSISGCGPKSIAPGRGILKAKTGPAIVGNWRKGTSSTKTTKTGRTFFEAVIQFTSTVSTRPTVLAQDAFRNKSPVFLCQWIPHGLSKFQNAHADPKNSFVRPLALGGTPLKSRKPRGSVSKRARGQKRGVCSLFNIGRGGQFPPPTWVRSVPPPGQGQPQPKKKKTFFRAPLIFFPKRSSQLNQARETYRRFTFARQVVIRK